MKSYRAAKEYGFINARIRGIMSRFLSIDDYETLLQSSSYNLFIKTLQQTYYGRLFEGTESRFPSPDTLAILLSRDFADTVVTLSRSLAGKVRNFADTYMNYFLAESLKSIIRGVHAGLEKEQILTYAVPTTPVQEMLFEDLAETTTVRELIDKIPNTEVRSALLGRLSFYEEYDSTAPLEVALEEWYLQKILDVLEQFSDDDKERVLGILEARVNLRNVLSAMRARVLGLGPEIVEISLVRFTKSTRILAEKIQQQTTWQDVLAALGQTEYAKLADRLAKEYEQSESLVEIELAIEDYIAQHVKRQMTVYPFHLGTVIGFFNLKFYEVKNVRSIAVGIERGESANTIRKMITIW